jgi:P pilus assembly chaperone PapD
MLVGGRRRRAVLLSVVVSSLLLAALLPGLAGADAGSRVARDGDRFLPVLLSPTQLAFAGPRLTMTPARQDVGGVRLGSRSEPVAFTVTNVGDLDAHLLTSGFSGPDAGDFTESDSDCMVVHGGTLQPGDSCMVSGWLRPTATGTRSATLTVAPSNANNVSGTVSGTGVAATGAAATTVTPSSAGFGGATVGSSSAARTVTVANDGDTPTTISSIAVGGADASDYSADADDCMTTNAGRLDPGRTCRVVVTFTPTATGARSAQLLVTSDGGTPTVDLSGTGTQLGAPSLTISPTENDFGAVEETSTSSPQTFTITNTGGSLATIGSLDVAGGDTTDFGADTDNCIADLGGRLPPGASCTVTVTFSPTRIHTRVGYLRVASDGGSPTSALTGTGLAAAVTMSPPIKDFGSVQVGSQSNSQTFTIRNSGTGVATFESIEAVGGDPNDFPLDTDDCLRANGGRLAAGSSCTVTATFAPQAAGRRTAELDVITDGGSPTAALSGTGTVPNVTISPTSFDFGGEQVGSSSAAHAFTITNNGAVQATINSIGVTGANRGDFAASTDDCMRVHGGRLDPGRSCRVSVVFTPSAAGQRLGSLSVTSSGGNPSSSLAGTGTARGAANVTVAPTSSNFGGVAVGSSSTPRSFKVTNTGGATATISGIDVAGADRADFTPDPSDCTRTDGGRLDAGRSCTVLVTFSPRTTGAQSAQLDVTSDGGNPTSDLLGTGTQSRAPSVTVLPTAADFGGEPVGSTSAARAFTVTNNGGSTATIGSIGVIGADRGDFTPDLTDCMSTDGGTLAPGQSCTVPVTFRPTATGPRSAQLAVSSDGGDPTSDLAGTGTQPSGPSVTVTPPNADFGGEPIGTTSAPQTFTVTNDGGSTATIGSIGIIGTDRGDFAVDPADCMTTHAGRLDAGRSCRVSVTFTPTTPGERTAQLSVASDGGSPSSDLSGTGTQSRAPSVTVLPTAADFGGEPVRSTSTPRSFVVVNEGGAEATITSIGVTGADRGDFTADADDCMRAHSGTLAPGGSCTVSVTFTPSVAGPRSAQLVVDSDGGDPTSQLSGTGTQANAPSVTLLPTAADFGGEPVGSTSAARTFVVSNDGGATATIGSIGVVGADRGDFAPNVDDCMTTNAGRLDPGRSCRVTVTFTPAATGARTAQLAVTSDGGDPTSDLSGTGTEARAPSVTVAPTEQDFGGVPVGSTSGPQTFTVTNDGGATATISAIGVAGGDAADFSPDASDCMVANGGTLDPGRTCRVTVTFTPSAAGQRTAQLTVRSDGGTPSSALSGRGTAPRVTITPGAADFGSVAVGSSGSPQQFTIANEGDAQATLTFIRPAGADAGDFSADTDECLRTDGGVLDPGRSCRVTVTFSPTAPGPRTAQLAVVSDGGNPSSNLTGRGTAPQVAITPSLRPDFGGWYVATPSDPRVFTVRNIGTATATISSTTMTGGNASDFGLDDDNCMNLHGGTLAVGESCTVSVTFTPGAIGLRSSTLVVISDGGTPTVGVQGSGMPGGGPAVSLTPPELDFGSVTVDTASPTQAVTLRNAGVGPATIGSITLDGRDAADFTVDDSDCMRTHGGTLGAGETCSISLTMTPSHHGEITARLNATTSGGNPNGALTGSGTG